MASTLGWAPPADVRRRPAAAWRTVRLCWAESRPTVQAVFALRALVGFLASPATLRWHALLGGRVLFGFGAWVLALFGVYLVNGICDAEEDATNGVGRPIGSGRLAPAAARRVYLTAVVLSLVLAAVLGVGFLGLDVAVMLVGLAYSARPVALSRTTAGAAATVLVLGLLTYVAGARIAGGTDLLADTDLLVVAGAMSAWMALVGAVAKDLSDVEGDAAAGRRTLAVALGPRVACGVVAVSAPAVGVGFLVAAVTVAPALIVPAALTVLGAAVVAVAALTAPLHGERAVRRRPYRAFMLTQYAATLAAVIVLL